MRTRVQTWLLIGCFGVGAAPAWAAGRNPPLTTAELLVDLARDHGLAQRGRQTETDVQHIRTLLRAALRLNPKQTDACLWLYELATLAGDAEEAGRMLTALVDADPTHQGAFALWLQAGLRAHQTAEQRAKWLDALAATRRPPAMLAMIHVERARLALERMNTPAARRELEQALTLEPGSPEAALLWLQTLEQSAPPAERLAAILRALQVQPLSLDLTWQAASLLDHYGLAAEAGLFFDYARQTFGRSTDPGELPGAFLLDRAHNLMARDQSNAAVEEARAAIAADPLVAAEAGLFLHYLLARAGRTVEAAQVAEQLAQRFAGLRDPAQAPVNEVAQAAWYYCSVQPQPQRALMLAEAAAARAPDDDFVRRVLGWAQADNLRIEDARRTLETVAGRDAFAAALLAKLLRDAGDELGAVWTINRLDPRPAVGQPADLLAALDLPAATTAPASQPADRAGELRRVLARFDARAFNFVQQPGAFLDAQVTPEDLGPAPGEPWWATFSLTNRGPFPIVLGPDGLVNPVFLLSFSLEGDRRREYPTLMTVSVDAVRVLYPGQTVRLRRTLDVGPPRRVVQQTPQQLQRVTIRALLDAERGPDGVWRPARGGQELRPVYLNRIPAVAGRAAVGALFSTLTGDSEAERVRALNLAAELWGERQRAERGALNYRPEPVPTDRLREALLNLLDSPSWELRVRTLAALDPVGLDRGMAAAVERCAEHPHWLVRLMAVRVLARQGEAFADRAARIAQTDADELVRDFAGSCRQRSAGTAASAPTTP